MSNREPKRNPLPPPAESAPRPTPGEGETPTNSELADLIERFIAHVKDYLTWDFTRDLSLSVLDLKTDTERKLDGIEKAAHRVGDARNAILKEGPALAQAMEKIGEDSSGVLSIVHFADGAGGPRAIRPEWRQIKIPLQRLAARLRLPAQADGFGSFPGGGGKAGQREALLSSEIGLEKSRYAGAQPTISTNENGAETPATVRTDGAQVLTLGQVRQWAVKLADETKAKAEGADVPSLYLAACYTTEAFRLAEHAAQWTRENKPPDLDGFVCNFAQLHEFLKRAKELLEGCDKGKVWAHWPAAPGTMYCWQASNSALAVAYDFAGMIESQILCNCPVSYNVLSTPCDTPAFVQWRDKAIAGIRERSLPPAADWPRWMMHRDRQALLCKLRAEYDAAMKKIQSHSSPLSADPGGPEVAQETNAETNWRDVQKRLLRLRDAGEPFTSQRDLAKRLNCSVGTIHKAVKDSEKLKGWAARAKGSPKAQSLNEVTTDNTPSHRETDPADGPGDDEIDRVMGILIEQAKPAERAGLNELSADGRREMARLYLEQQAEKHIEDKAPGGNRVLGRKP